MNQHQLLNDEQYFGDKHYFSTSLFKAFKKCEYSAFQGLEGERDPPSDALLVGSYVDEYISGNLEQFIAKNPSIMSSRGASKGDLKAEFKKAGEICQFIDDNPRLTQFLSGDKQTIMVGEIGKVPFKVKLDSYAKGKAISDLKVMRTVTDSRGNFYDFITPWGYDIQMATYQEIVYQNTGERLPTFIVAVTKESPINSVIINIPQLVLDRALYSVEEMIGHYADVKNGIVSPTKCGTCPKCIASRVETPIISMMDIVGTF